MKTALRLKRFALAFSIICCSITTYGVALTGTYTIGGSTPDYATFTLAVADLVTEGVSGPVVFDVRDGTYPEQISIAAVTGASGTNTITFQSESGDSTAVILTYTPASGTNYTVRFNGCDYVSFSTMTIRAIGASYAHVIDILGSATNNEISNCLLEGSTTTSTSINMSVIYEGTGTNTNFGFSNNIITSGSYGIYFSGTTSGLVISDNDFTNQYYRAMYLYQMNAASVQSNTISSNTGYTSFRGIEMQYCDNTIQVLKNVINITNGQYGLYLYYCDGTSGNRGLIGNNFINMGGSSGTCYGIYTYRCTYQNFYYNSVNVTRSGTNNRAFYQGYTSSGTSNFQLQNNIFANNGGGYAIYIDYPSSINVSNFNDLYTTGTNLGYWSGNRTSLSAWQSASIKDANSISVDPEFVSNTDLHVQAYLADDLGFPVAEISDDIDGTTRDLVNPDMGAAEWTTPANDAGVTSINQALTYCIDNDSVYVTIKNYGSATLTSVQVNWDVNAALQTPFSWTGSLIQGASEGPFSVGFYNFTLGGQYDINAWTTIPNAGSEGFTHNDASAINNVYQAMSGTYTIGGTTPDYATFNAAVVDLVNGGVCGPVIFDVRSGTYNEQVSISAVSGTNSTNTVTFQSESGDSSSLILTSTPTSGANYTVRYNGCDYVTFRQMTIRAIGSTYATVISLQGTSTNCSVTNCELEGSTTTSTSINLAVVYEGSGTQTNTTFMYNNIENGSYGFYMSGTTSGLAIHNNNFSNQYYRGMYLYQMSAASVQSNTISSNTGYTSFRGIEMQYCDNSIQVLKNVIDITNGQYGLYMYYCDGTSGNRGLIGNNFIHMGGSSGTCYGIYTYRSTYQNFYYNSINVTRSGTNNRAFYQGYTSSGTSNFQLQNNIFANNGGGYAIYIDYPSSINVSNFNDLYTTGTNLGYWSGNRTSLSAWQSASIKDANSISVDPEFVSNTDLNVQAYLADDLGFPVAEISDDFYGATRDVIAPDMGAVEWTTPVDDAGVTAINQALTYCIDYDSVYVTIKNYGSANMTACQVNWTVNSVLQTPFAWTGNLAQGASDGSFSIGFYNFMLGGQYDIVAWTTLPNGNPEGFTHNDQSVINNVYQAMSGTYTIGGTTPDYATFNAAVVDLVNGGVCGPVVFNVRNGTYNEQVSISAVSGTNSTNTVTFQSESGDSSLLILTTTPTSGANYTVRYNGCDYVTFRQMTIRAIGSTYSTAISLQGTSTNCSVTNCELEGSTTTSTSINLAVVYEGSGTQTNTTFMYNNIKNGSYGFYMSGTTSGLTIHNNNFSNQYYRGMYLYQMSAASVQSNTIASNTGYTSFRGIEMQYCDNSIQVLKNVIDITNGQYGLYMYYCDGTSGNRGLIGNNFIHMGGSSGTCYGIYTYRCTYQNFYYNSINVTRSGTNNRAFYQGYTSSGTSNFQLQNNIFANNGGGYAIYIDYPSSINVSDFNDLYTTGTNLGYWSGNRTSLSAWQSASIKDANSISVDPEYVTSVDLHTQGYLTDDLGFPVAEISDDIDGETRDLITPDMGADEWTTPVDDAGVTSINQALTYCIDNDSVYVTIKNYGTTNLTAVQVNWDVNTVLQTPYAWTGNIAQGGSEGPFSVGFYNFTLGGQYDISAWTSLPNGNAEGLTHNDQSDLNNIYQAMSGTYTIGGTTPDYATFGAAVTDLVNGGVCGPVVFNVRNGTYNEQVSISAVSGTNSTNTVTFQSENGDSSLVTLTSTPGSGTNYTVRYNGCDYVTFRQMTLRAIGSTYSTAVAIQGTSTNCSIENCEIFGSTTTSSSANLAVIYEGSGTQTNASFLNNNISNGSYGIYFSGTTSGLTIENNDFSNQYYRGMYLYQMSAVSVQSNTIASTTTYTSFRGIELQYCDNKIEIKKNIVNVTNGQYGLYMYYCDGTSGNRGEIANNFIHMGGTTGTCYGIYTYRSTYQNFYYNSVNITRTGTSNRAFYQGYTSSGTSNFQLNNNVFANVGGGYAIYIDYPTSITVSNFNDFYTTGANLAYWSGNRANLAAWTAASAKDGNSVSLDPQFVSSIDLHSCAVGLSNVGTPVAGVTDDIDGATRDLSFPDIGADEFDTALTVTLGADTSACGAFVLDAGNPGATYDWSTGSTNQSITATVTGQYYVEVTNACGVDQDTINVNINTNLFVDLGPDTTICSGGNIVLDASNAGATFLWSTTATTQTIVASSTNTYSVNVDNGFCSGDDTIVVTISSPIVVSTSGTDENCGGGDGTATAAPTGGTAPYTYAWDDSGTQTTVTATGLAAGTYNVTVSDANACTQTSSQVVGSSVSLSSSISGFGNISCFGACDGFATVTIVGGTAPFTYLWNDPSTQTTAGATNLCAGTYIVSVTDSNTCTSTDTITLTDPAELVLIPSSTDASCSGADGSASIFAAGGVPGYTYLWNDPGTQTNSTASNLASGSYIVVVTDATSCSKNDTVTVSNAAAMSASISFNTNVDCFGNCNALASANVSGGTSPFTYTWDDPGTQASATAVGLCAGMVTVQIVDASGCSAADSVTILGPAILAANTSTTDATCGSSDGTATATPTGGTAPYSYGWDDPSSQTNTVASSLAAGNYNVTVTDAQGCTANGAATVSTTGGLSTSISAFNDASCFGACDGNVTVNVSGGATPFTYAWDDPSTQTSPVAVGLCAGTYSVTVTDNGGCSSSQTQIVGEPSEIVLTVSATLASCGIPNGTASVSVTGGATPYTYVWSDGNTQTTSTATGLVAGSYTILVTDASNCNEFTTAAVSDSSNISAVISNTVNVSCFGGVDGQSTVSASGGTAPYTYLWNDVSAQTTAGAINLLAGIYTVQVTDAIGCSVVITDTIAQPAALALTMSAVNATVGNTDGSATVSVSGGVAPYTYAWNDPGTQTSATASSLGAGTYTASITDANGCTASDTISVVESAAGVITVSITFTSNVDCFGDCDGIAVASASGGVGTFTYLWNDPATQSFNTATGLCAGTYSVLVTDAAGDTGSVSATITGSPEILLAMSSGNATIGNADGSASASVSGGAAPYTYAWDDPSTQTNPMATNLGAGLYTVSITDANGCSASDTVSVIESAGGGGNITVTITFTSNVDCFGDCDGIAVASGSGGTGTYSYLWDDAAAQTTNSATGLCAGTYSVKVMDTGVDSGAVTTTITESAEIVLTHTSSDANCGGPDGTATVSASGGAGGFSYLWNDPSSQTDSTATGLTPGDYIAAVTDANNCTVSDTATVGSSGSITATISFSTTLDCNGDCDALATAGVIGGSSPYSYLWDDPSAQTNTTAVDLCAGTYIVQVSDAGGCTDADTVIISEPTVLNVSTTDVDVTPGMCDGSANATATGGTTPYDYLWDDPSASIASGISNLCAAIYTVTVTDANGCSMSSSTDVKDPTVGIVDVADLVQINIYPNPSRGEFNIEVTSIKEEVKAIRIIDLTGRTVLLKEINILNQTDVLAINLLNESSGIYEVQIITEGGIVRKTIAVE